MIATGLIFKWLNVVIIISYLIYQALVRVIPQIQRCLADKRKNRLDQLAVVESLNQECLVLNTAISQQQLFIDQLSSKIAQWHSYEMEAKKKLQSHHSKIYHDAKKRIEHQTHFLRQHTTLLTSVDTLLDATHQELCALMDQHQQNEYAHALINTLKKETNGL